MADANTVPPKATTLREAAAQTSPQPLESGDPRYVDLSKQRQCKQLAQMRVHIEQQDAEQNRFACVAFIGHRGSGKSTELLRLEHDLSSRFTSVHLYTDEDLLGDFDYTDLLLWLTESLVRHFANTPGLRPLDERLLRDVAEWFADKTLEDAVQVKAEVEAGVEARVGIGWFGIGLLARLKSMVKGSTERRQTIRQKLRSYGSELIEKVNLLLDDAAAKLRAVKKAPDLLIVQDNLDRLFTETARRLFFDAGDLLKRLHAHMIFTVPVAIVLSPWDINRVFQPVFTMPMIKLRRRDGREVRKAVDGLVKVLAERVEIDAVFESRASVRLLARSSGGSVRDLIRLLSYAQLAAAGDGKQKIDAASARDAVKKLRLDYEKLLIPGQAYYPVLALIHRDKELALPPDGSIPSPEQVDRAKAFLRDLLFNGAVLEYNGDRTWYDVHPAITDIQGFKDAFAAIEKKAIGSAPPPR
jgi:hypothetical protein